MSGGAKNIDLSRNGGGMLLAAFGFPVHSPALFVAEQWVKTMLSRQSLKQHFASQIRPKIVKELI
jgi:hypothetical protein